jgi:proline dehydrogenase
MLRGAASFVARRSRVRKLVMTTPVIREVAWRFVAGEDLDAGLAAVRALNGRGIRATLNLVGTHVRDAREAVAAADEVIESLRRIRDAGVESHVSVKLTQIGLDIDEALCRTQLERILDRAAEVGAFVRIDMEELVYIERTIRLFEEMLARYGEDTVGIVLQSYVRTRPDDLERLLRRGARIRLVKGGYWEQADAVYRGRDEIDAAFGRDIDQLLRRGRYPAIATHDPKAIDRVRALRREIGLDKRAFEFQMLYGVRPDLQAALVRQGYTVRCYVPYGAQWYAYVLGCLRRVPGGTIRRITDRVRHRPALS